ncbi:cytochrome p450 716b1 [Quercus suber]|uniref:Cytochrome p450 716b1 n=1 Tax=Quercus suber TaxID=58331 RepID=A0AAW0KNA5_QUESU
MLLSLAPNHYDINFVAVFSVVFIFLVSKAWRRVTSGKNDIPGRLGLPYLGETISFLSATNSTKGCYDFVRLRRLWYGKWFKTRMFGKIHVFVPNPEGARMFVKKFDKMLCERLKNLEEGGKSFVVLEFSMKLTFDAMCNMLMSITEESLLRDIERDCTSVSNAMLSIPFMIPGTRYYKGIKARERLMETFREIICRRRSGKESPEDFLQSMLQRDSYPSSEKLDDSEIMDNLLTLIVAGQTTTAAAMMWSVKFLDENREAQDKLRIFLSADLFNAGIRPAINVGISFISEYHSFEIKKGWHVNIDAACIHYDPDLYKDPRQFDPSRFDEMQKPYSFIAFGSGPRTCLGMNMAKVTMLVFLHRLTSGYKWTVDDLDVCLEKKAHIPRLRSGCPITLKPI